MTYLEESLFLELFELVQLLVSLIQFSVILHKGLEFSYFTTTLLPAVQNERT